jgi:uncharacterized protein (UPF0332 family)
MMVNKNVLIIYKVNLAEETLDEAKLAIENNKPHLAANCIYYSVFNIVSALALQKDFITFKHLQLLSWFNKEFVKTEMVDKKLGKFYLDAFKMRQEGDYDDPVKLDLHYVKVKFIQAQEFVKTINEVINL